MDPDKRKILHNPSGHDKDMEENDRYGVTGHVDGNSTDRSNTSQSKSKNGFGGGNNKHPVIPPKIDRHKKPAKKSAAERLFGHRAQHTSPDVVEKQRSTAVDYGSLNQAQTPTSNSNSYNPHNSGQEFDSFKRISDPGYSTSGGGSNVMKDPAYAAANTAASKVGTGIGEPGYASTANSASSKYARTPVTSQGCNLQQPSATQQNGAINSNYGGMNGNMNSGHNIPATNGVSPPHTGLSGNPSGMGLGPTGGHNGINGYATTGMIKPLPPNNDKYR